MATIQIYNHTAQLFASGQCLPSDTFKLMLLDSSASFDATDTTLDAVSNSGAYEVFGNGWTEGGEELDNVAVTTVTTNDAKFDADDVLVEITGGALDPYSYQVLFDSTHVDSPPLAFITLTAAQTIADGGIAGAVWNLNGIFKWAVA